VQVIGQPARRQQILLHVVEAAAVDRPLLAAHALVERFGVLGLLEAVVEHHEIQRRADPRDGRDDVDPAQQQVGPVEVVAVHVVFFGGDACRLRLACSPPRAL